LGFGRTEKLGETTLYVWKSGGAAEETHVGLVLPERAHQIRSVQIPRRFARDDEDPPHRFAFDRDRRVPDALAEALGGIGDARAARAYVEAYRKAGVTLPAVRPITFPDAPWYRRTVEEAAGW